MSICLIVGSLPDDGFDRITIDQDTRVARRGDRWMRLPRSELGVFRHLLMVWPRTQSKDEIVQGAYGPDLPTSLYPEPKIIDVLIHKMRPKLSEIGCSIETVWGRGYRLQIDGVAS